MRFSTRLLLCFFILSAFPLSASENWAQRWIDRGWITAAQLDGDRLTLVAGPKYEELTADGVRSLAFVAARRAVAYPPTGFAVVVVDAGRTELSRFSMAELEQYVESRAAAAAAAAEQQSEDRVRQLRRRMH